MSNPGSRIEEYGIVVDLQSDSAHNLPAIIGGPPRDIRISSFEASGEDA